MSSAKPFPIPRELVWKAYKQVKEKGGAPGIDKESIEAFDADLSNNLYKLWNRMASGSYFPPKVRGVSIPKKSGGSRLLGIPTVADRIAQTVVKLTCEPQLEPIFHSNSFGYRPGRSAHDAIAITRERCWKYPWVVEFDIKGLFDNIDHELLMRAVRKHINSQWVLIYIERWLKAAIVLPDGSVEMRNQGTPQGGVISPVLANLFLHYAFDLWMDRTFPHVPFCRYADDGLMHCTSRKQAEYVLSQLKGRLLECKLEIHPAKSGIVHCKTEGRPNQMARLSFDFLGFQFCPRVAKRKDGRQFQNFSPGVSRGALKSMKQTVRRWKLQLRHTSSIQELAKSINPVLRGWSQYYGAFYKSALRTLWRNVNDYLARWVTRKYRRFKRHKVKAINYLAAIARDKPRLFVHWQLGRMPGT